MCICITHHPPLPCRIPRGSQGYSSPNLSASSVWSKEEEEEKLAGTSKSPQVIPDWFLRVLDASPQRCPPPSMVAAPGPTLTDWQTDYGVRAHWRSAARGTVGKTSPLTQNTGNGEAPSNQRAERDEIFMRKPRNQCACVGGTPRECSKFSSFTVHELI